MHKKLCCHCLKISVSADYLIPGEWQCTHCGRDITDIPAIPYHEEFSKEYLMRLTTYKQETKDETKETALDSSSV
ncbi:hypothetical protein [Aneurinibacillus migulanus]|uniref:Uncharacterized protein n=1 Tax=Aneurinibacillus migulanus TaxID=47500 RepID=A0A1G8U1L9_ANEMI|nr:hypothetical protein [Aneurinibacillus migulanus]MED0893488.1 hypothetical protein [Aneurinibacillus migulanus]MED1616410.1 hypothetical protein [Aneurinibacillus migulanus]GED17538.1 hypothetical protein AMI01nite_55290 [Aneurinibacillus migulanus]SDJ47524.1 hypothetical protein SAMN04487909_118105 [Aneurinibacillus migulanus]